MSNIELAMRALIRRPRQNAPAFLMMVLLLAALVSIAMLRGSIAGITPRTSGPQITAEDVSEQQAEALREATGAGAGADRQAELAGTSIGLVSGLLMLIAGISLIVMVLVEVLWVRGRRREMGIRRALGASRRDIAVQLACEILVLAAVATLAGHLIARLITPLLAAPIAQRIGDGAVQVAPTPELILAHVAGFVIIPLVLACALAPILAAPPRSILSSHD